MADQPHNICSYEGSDYQSTFWDQGERLYEDQVEAIALKRLLPSKGSLLLELGAGAGRNTPRYRGFERVVLLDYSLTQLEQAHSRLGDSSRYLYVAADVNRLPFAAGLFDAATMIRVLHHMPDALWSLQQVSQVLQPEAVFILEFANKHNLKAILRYLLKKQAWSPFSLEPVEFAALNFDFHPKAVRAWLSQAGFSLERLLTVSHFRVGLLKRFLPLKLLVALDSLLQRTGNWVQLSPSVFARCIARREASPAEAGQFFRCLECDGVHLVEVSDYLECRACGKRWPVRNGIYDFRGIDS
jgi:ubiquinone/menaquinone biosynthesis C-methylase UbiE